MTGEILVALTSNEWIAIIVAVLIIAVAGTLLGEQLCNPGVGFSG